ncbi:MAG TPA: elongation factor P maturation arginine rhamnosyltransferase EarP, partial [Ramlibacter sp.]
MDLGHTRVLWTIRVDRVRPAMLWDIFCKVIDNHGDIGVCWRL